MHDTRSVSVHGDHADANQIGSNHQQRAFTKTGGGWYVYLHLSFDENQFLASCATKAEADRIASGVQERLKYELGRTYIVRVERVSESRARRHALDERVRVNQERGVRGDMAVEAIAARLAIQFTIDVLSPAPSASEPVPAADEEFWPAAAFPKGMAARLRMAARKSRKTKRVASKVIDGVVCYSVADARRWWPDEMQPGALRRNRALGASPRDINMRKHT
jgi:hypothetical protein